MACPQPLPEPTAEARLLLTEFVQSDKVAVVAMKSCEFCWTIFKLLKAIGVDYSALNFDALEYAPNNLGNEIRASVQEHTGAVTFPQIFVGGKYIGGAADACLRFCGRSGRRASFNHCSRQPAPSRLVNPSGTATQETTRSSSCPSG